MSNTGSPGFPASPRRSRIVFGRVVLGLVLVVALLYFGLRDTTPPLSFSPEAWRAPHSKEESWSPRRAMLEDLFRRHPLVGMKRADVEQLLGPPDHEPWSDLYPGAGYEIGLPHPGGFGDSDYVPLLLYYDGSGVVREVRVF